jgi:hypothetical protein
VANTDFDPDAYLNAVPQAAGAFDPDKYLAAPATGPKPNPDMLPQPAGDDVQPLPAGATESDRRRRDIAALATQQPYRNSVFGTAGALTPEEAQAERAKRIAEAQDTSAAATEERRRLAAQQATADAMGPANIKRGRANYSPNPVPSAIKEEEAAEAAAKTARDAPLPTMTAGRQAADRFTSSVLDGVRTGVRGMLELGGASNSLDHVGKVGAGRTEQSALDRASEATKNWIAEAFPADKAREKDFWTSQLPQGAGSSVPFLVAGLAARAVGAGDSVMTGIMAATGAGQQAGSEVEAFDEAIKKRRSVLDGLLKAKTPDEFRDQFFEEKDALRKALGPEEYNRVARIVAGHDPVAMQQVMQQLQVTRAGLDSVALKRMAVLFANAGIGTTEALPISNALERMNALSGGAVARIAKAGAANSFEEFVQEVGQQLGQNFVQGVVYDKAQDIYEGAADAGKVAAMIGLFQGGGMQAFHEAMNIGRSSGSLPLPGTVPPLLNPQDQANELRDILGEPRVEPPPGAAPVTAAADSRSILGEDPESRRPDDTDKSFAKRVVDNRPAPTELPEDHGKYFEMGEGTTVVPISDIISSKSDVENAQGGENGAKRMAAAAAGELSRRAPISVRQTPDGRYVVVDGNGTLTSVKKYGWQTMPVEVLPPEPYTPGIKATGVDDADQTKRLWAALSPIRTIDDLYTNAPELQRGLIDVGREIAETTGATLKIPPGENDGVKGRERVQEKIDGGKAPGRINDVVRMGFSVDLPSQGDDVARLLAERFEVVDEGWAVTPVGYFDRKVLVKFPNGQVGEVQIWHPDLLRAKEDKGHRLYVEARKLPKGTPRKAELEQKMREIYEEALANSSPQWKALLGNAGSLGNLASNAALSSTRPSIPTSAESAAAQPSALQTHASPGAQTNGSPSNTPNFTPAAIASSPTEDISGNANARNGLIGVPVPGMQPHRVTDADGRAVEVAPVVVEAASLRTSRDKGYDKALQPRDRDRAASDAQIREIENKLDPERLGYSSEADRGAPIVGSDGMVESGNGRVIALRNLYDKKRPQAKAYRDWLRSQGVNADAYQQPVLVRQRLTPLSQKEREDFTMGANRPATLAMSAPEIAVSDARHMNARMLGLIKNPDDLGSPANSGFFRSFLSLLPKSEHGTLADSKGHLSSVGLTRARNAILAKAYGDSDVLARIAESTNDDVKSISNALTAAAPAWAAMRADVEAGHVRADMDITPALVRAVEQTAEIRSRGEKLDTFLAQQDAFDRLPAEVEGFMRMFYDPQGRRAASARRITDALRFVANEASKVSAEKSLGLDLIPVEPQDIQRLAREREWQDVEQGLSEPGRSPGDGARDEASGRQARGPWLSARGEVAAQRGDEVDPVEEAIRAQRPTLEELRGPARVTEKTRAGDQFVFPGGERISSAELARRRAAEPLKPRAVQKATDFGLFGETAPQGDLLTVAPLKAANVAPTITAEETGDGRPGIQPSAPQVPGRTQARRLAKTPAVRPQELPLFGWQPSGGQIRDVDVPVRPEPGGQEPPVHGEGPSVTKPPTRGGRNRPGRTDLPAVKGRLEAEKKIAERSRSNYRITPEDQVGVGNARQKINGNIAAIRTLKAIQDENRFATPEEKAILVRYVGWGAFAQDMFATHKPEWKNERDAFRALVSDDEYNSARESTLNAHFTSPDVIRGMWDAMAHLGFKGGQAIEPAAGVGHFIGLIPDKVASKTAWTAVELDPLTGGIAKALYGGSDVAIHGFEDLKRPSNYYDLAISNVPFGQYHISEKPYGSFPIHDFFFVKSLDKVRPGGVVAFITSRYTMDRVDPETRRLLGQSADLVGAIRLPGGRKGAFAGNAGTEVTTDIIFLRKKVPGEPAFPGANWSELKEIKTPEGPVQINEYFADRPEMMLGEMRLQGSMYQANEPVLVGDPEGIQQRIAAAARKMPEGALLPMESPPPPPISANEIGAGIKDGSFFLQNGNLYQRRQGQGFENPVNPEDHDRLARLIGMRGIINDLLQTQLDAGENAKARSDQLRGELRRAYDAFVDAHGPINKEIRTVTNRLDKQGEPVVIVRHPNLALFRKDPDAWKVAAIEDYDSETGKTKRAAIQTKDVIDPPKERQINGPSDALSASLNDTAGVDLDHIAQSLNLDSHDAVVEALAIWSFRTRTAASGRPRTNTCRATSSKSSRMRAYSRRLTRAICECFCPGKGPAQPLTGTDITAQFGAPWIPERSIRTS